MSPFDSGQRTTVKAAIDTWLTDCKSRRLSPGTLYFYVDKVRALINYCDENKIEQVEVITPDDLRRLFLSISETHNSGGQHAHHRAIKTFFRWYQAEYEPENWKNPINKIKAPEVREELLDPITLEDIRKLIKTCKPHTLGKRDKAIFYILIDTGLRANELLNLDISDFDPETGQLTIRNTKSRKPRAAFTSFSSRRALRSYLRTRETNHGAMFINQEGRRLRYYGLRSILVRHCEKAGVDTNKTLHSFRRGFAIEMLRGHADTLSLQRLLGHADPRVTGRYTKLLDDDLREVHSSASPGDKL